MIALLLQKISLINCEGHSSLLSSFVTLILDKWISGIHTRKPILIILEYFVRNYSYLEIRKHFLFVVDEAWGVGVTK